MTTTLSRLAAWLAFILLAGCGDARTPQIEPVPCATLESSRFSVQTVAWFWDQYGYNNKRAIYLLTDTTTGKEFVGISGVGIAELGSHATVQEKAVGVQEDER